jgi:hypothetical protein
LAKIFFNCESRLKAALFAPPLLQIAKGIHSPTKTYGSRVTRLGHFSPIGLSLTLASFFKVAEICSLTSWGIYSHKNISISLTKKFWARFWAIFSPTHLATLLGRLGGRTKPTFWPQSVCNGRSSQMSRNKKRFYFRFFQVGFSAFFQNEKNLF